MIISKFRKMYGDIEPEILTERSEESYQELPKIQVSTTASSIARYWLSRAKRNRKLFSQIYSIIYSMKEERCIVCGSRFGLQSELIQNVEDLFMQFKREQADDQKYRLHYWNVEYWQEFVKHHGLFRTICLTCLEKVENFNAESAAKQRKQGYVRFVNFKIPATSKLEIDQCTRDIGKIWLDLVRNKVIK